MTTTAEPLAGRGAGTERRPRTFGPPYQDPRRQCSAASISQPLNNFRKAFRRPRDFGLAACPSFALRGGRIVRRQIVQNCLNRPWPYFQTPLLSVKYGRHYVDHLQRPLPAWEASWIFTAWLARMRAGRPGEAVGAHVCRRHLARVAARWLPARRLDGTGRTRGEARVTKITRAHLHCGTRDRRAEEVVVSDIHIHGFRPTLGSTWAMGELV